MVLLLPVERAAPLPVAHRIRAVPDGVPGHLAHLTAVQRIVHRRPVHKARLRLHHPEVPALETAREVMHDAVPQRVQMAASDVVVPRRQVQLRAQRVVVEDVVPAHEVAGDELAGIAVGADDLDLNVLIVLERVRDEMLEFDQQAGIHSRRAQGNLAPVGVSLAPVVGRPVVIQVVESLELRPQPVLELLARHLVPGNRAILVVDLPSQHIRIVPEPFRHLPGDAAAELPVARAVGGGLRAAAVRGLPAVHLGLEGVGILLGKPGWWRRGRRSQDDENVVPGRQRDGTIQPIQVEPAFLRLHPAPREFAHPHHVDSRRLHQLEVLIPARLGPLLRIPCRPEQQRGRLRRGGLGMGPGRQYQDRRHRGQTQNRCSSHDSSFWISGPECHNLSQPRAGLRRRTQREQKGRGPKRPRPLLNPTAGQAERSSRRACPAELPGRRMTHENTNPPSLYAGRSSVVGAGPGAFFRLGRDPRSRLPGAPRQSVPGRTRTRAAAG